MKQGVECTECGRIFHRKCGYTSHDCAHAIPERFLDDNETKVASRAENYLRSLQKINGLNENSQEEGPLGIYDMMDVERKKRIRDRSTLGNIGAIMTSHKFRRMLIKAATNEQSPREVYLASREPLNPQITTRNFTRFISRCGPVFAFRDEMVLLLTWHDRIDTFISLIIYCLLCVYPKLLFILPELILISIVLFQYSGRRGKVEKHRQPVKKVEVCSLDTTNNKKKSTDGSIFSFDITNLFQPSSEVSPEYLRNFQNIQNLMGEFVDTYDWITAYFNQYNGSSESEVSVLLLQLLLITITLSILVYLIPIKAIFLTLGISVYVSNTQFIKCMIRQLKPYVVQSTQRKVECIRVGYHALEDRCQQLDSHKEVSVYQNEGWSEDGYGGQESVLNGMKPWSDYEGSTGIMMRDDRKPPNHYKWDIGAEWMIDTKGPWIDDSLGIEIVIPLDKDGWAYGNSDWIMENSGGTVGDTHPNRTRRRRWTRMCGRIQIDHA